MLVIFIVIKVIHHGSGPADIAFFVNTFTPDGLGNLGGTGRTFERYIMKERSILFKIDTGSEQHTVERLADTQSFTGGTAHVLHFPDTFGCVVEFIIETIFIVVGHFI